MGYLFYILFVVISPLIWIIQTIYARLWYPNVKPVIRGTPDKSLRAIDYPVDIKKYRTGDGCKFAGMNYLANRKFDTAEEAWDEVKTYWDLEKYEFFRSDDKDYENRTAFSGDMMAGMTLALATRYRENKFTNDEKSFLAELAWRFCITNKIPFKFSSEKDRSRGFHWSPFDLALDSVYHIGVIMKIGYKFQPIWWKKIILATLYKLITISYLPFYFTGVWDHNAFIGKTCLCQWYKPQSDLISYLAGYLMDMPFALRGINVLNDRYGRVNADISSVAYATLFRMSNHEYTYSLISDLIKSRDGSTFGKYPLVEYISIKQLRDSFSEWISGFKDILKSDNKFKDLITQFKNIKTVSGKKEYRDRWVGGFTCHDRVWERNALEYGRPNSNLGDLDIRFALSIMEGALRFDK